MTTIAWDGKTLATDSRRTTNSIVESDEDNKLTMDVGGYLVVADCGDLNGSQDIIDWLKNGKKDEFPKIEDSSTVICLRTEKSEKRNEGIDWLSKNTPASKNETPMNNKKGALNPYS